MNLAINYSPQAAELLAAGAIQLDLFKAPDWPDLIAESSQLWTTYVHFPLHAGAGGLDAPALDRIEGFLGQTSTHHVNMHLSPRASRFGVDIHSQSPSDIDRLVEAMSADARVLAGRFGTERVALENLMWEPGEPHEIPCAVLLTETIRRTIEASGCRLLLDLAHARIAAMHLGEEPRRYIERLPVERLLEMHVSGTRCRPNGAWEDHNDMSDADWELTEWAFGRIADGAWGRPQVVAFEYGGVGPDFAPRSRSEVIARQLPRLWGLVKGQ